MRVDPVALCRGFTIFAVVEIPLPEQTIWPNVESKEFPAKSPKSKKMFSCLPNIVTCISIPTRLKGCTDVSQIAERGFIMWHGLRHSAENPSRALLFPRESQDSNQLGPISLKWFVWLLPKAHDAFVSSRLDPAGKSLSWKLTRPA